MAKLSVKGLELGQLPMLEPVLKKWQNLNRQIASKWIVGGELPWWYNERASLSIFAGAVWLCGGTAFEEFAVYREVAVKQQRQYKSGRCDIEFALANYDFFGEAKQCWPKFGSRTKDKALDEVMLSLKQAQREVTQVRERGYKRVGMTFVVPRIPFKAHEETEAILSQFLSQLQSIRNLTVVWIFPPFARLARPGQDSHNYWNVYPGVILVMAQERVKFT